MGHSSVRERSVSAHASSPAPPSPAFRPPTEDDAHRLIEKTVAEILDERLTQARAVDEVFAADVADRVARFVLRGGRRLRASFAWWGWRAAGGAPEGPSARVALQVAAALELIQACALIHDDLMDDSGLRRGGPAVHVEFAAAHREEGLHGSDTAWGRSCAVLAGDLALAWADDIIAEVSLDPGVRARLTAPWAGMRTEMVAGQYLDLRAQTRTGTGPDDALRIAFLKSALYTVERPVQLGAALAGADTHTLDALRHAARDAGLAFQLRDDLRGVFGDPRHTGKPSGEDVREGKLTYLAALARSRAEDGGDRATAAVLRAAFGDPALTHEGLDAYREAVTATGAHTAVEERISRLLTDALAHLAGSGAEPVAAAHLAALFRYAAGVTATADPQPRTSPQPPSRPGPAAAGDAQ